MLLNLQHVAVDECLSAFQCHLFGAVLLHLLLQPPGCRLVTGCLIGSFYEMDSLAVEQVAPHCNGKQLHFPQNVYVWRVCAYHSGSGFTLTLNRKHLFSACLTDLINFFNCANSFFIKYFKPSNNCSLLHNRQFRTVSQTFIYFNSTITSYLKKSSFLRCS